MIMEYTIKGVTLNACDLVAINEYYTVACTAEYLMENYAFNEKDAMRLGSDVRRLMSKYDYGEQQSIDEVIAKEITRRNKADSLNSL